MSEENKALITRVIDEMWNQRKVELADELYSKDFIAHDPNNPGTKGPEGMKEIVLKYVHAFPDTQFTIDDIFAEGDKVAMRWTAKGTHDGDLDGIAPSGKPISISGVSIDRIVDGKIVEEWSAWDAMGMMQQIGVIPAQASS